MTEAVQYCRDFLRERDTSLYASILFLPKQHRDAAFVLQAFHLEIGRIAFLVKEPMAGEIRLQWWRDIITGEREGEAQANPLALALLDIIKDGQMSRDGFIRYLDARTFDLYNDVIPDRDTLEAYFGETESFIYQATALACSAEQTSHLADACGHAGVATGMTRAMARLPYDRNRQRCFMANKVLADCGLSPESWYSESSPAHQAIVSFYQQDAKAHLEKARNAIRELPKTLQPVFLPLALTAGHIQRFQKAGSDAILEGKVQQAGPLGSQWALWKTAILGF